jgi:predicted MFS family arabinose efflux permease
MSQSEMTLGRIAATVLLPFGCGYFLSYLFRAVNAVVAPDLIQDVGISTEGLGLLTAAYLIAFAAFQAPLGVLLDRFGPRRVQGSLLLVAAAGAALFGSATSEGVLIIARALIGLGFAGGLMASFKAVALFAPPGRIPLLNSWVMAFGGVGVLVASYPAHATAELLGWRGLFFLLAGLTAAVACFIIFAAPRRGEPKTGSSLATQLRGLAHVYNSWEFWRIAPYVMTTAGAHIAIQTLWAAPWLSDVANLDRGGVAGVLTGMAGAFLVGILLGGAAADFVARTIKRGPLFVMHIAIGIFIVSQVFIVLGYVEWKWSIWLAFALTGQLGVLAYAHLADHFGADLAGRSNTALNLLLFGTAAAFQFGIGAALEHWPLIENHRPAEAYTMVFGSILALQMLTGVWCWIATAIRPGVAGNGNQ